MESPVKPLFPIPSPVILLAGGLFYILGALLPVVAAPSDFMGTALCILAGVVRLLEVRQRLKQEKNRRPKGPAFWRVCKGFFAFSVPSFRTVAESSKEAGKIASSSVTDVANDVRNLVEDPDKRQYRVETFEEAVSRLELSEKDLKQKYRGLQIIYVTALIAGWVFIAVVLGAFLGGQPFWALSAIPGLLFFFPAGIRSRFRAEQVKQRKLFSFGDYLRQMGLWVMIPF